MMSSECAPSVEEILDRLIERLNEDRLREVIDEPLERAASTFAARLARPLTQEVFLRTLGEFAAHVYETGLGISQRLSADQARAEAVHLLDTHYQNEHAKGYYAALVDAMDPCQDGVCLVLASLKGIIRVKERQNYVNAAIAGAVDPLDWPAQCALTERLLERFRDSWPAALQQMAPSRLAGEWPALLFVQLDAAVMLQDIARSPFACAPT